MRKSLYTAASIASVMFRAPLAKLTGREPDCWRRTLGLGLRSDATKFGLCALGLRIGGQSGEQRDLKAIETQVSQRLAEFLFHDPEVRWALRHRRHHVERVARSSLDLAVGRFDAQGGLWEIEPILNPLRPPPLDACDRIAVHAAMCAAHGRSRAWPESQRPTALIHSALVRDLIGNIDLRIAGDYMFRLAEASFLSIEPMPPERWRPPDFRRRRPLGCGMLNLVARLAPDGRQLDLWADIHHAAADGAPMQEMLGRLRKTWGEGEGAYFPPDDRGREPLVSPQQPCEKDRPITRVLDFINFKPLIRWRAAASNGLGQSVPLACALIWHLARQPEFKGRKISTAVDVPASGRRARAVDLVAICPEEYFARGDDFAVFAKDYLALLVAARVRKTSSFAAMRGIAFLPAWLAARLLTVNTDLTRKTFGTVGLTMLKDAQVFTAPMADVGWDDGFLAIGSMSLSDGQGGTVAAVTAKGDAEQIRWYPAAIRRAVASCTDDGATAA